jgi:hypothetical protein
LISQNSKIFLTFILSEIERNIKRQLEKEKKFAQEQRFYSGIEHSLKGYEVNEESVQNLPDVPNHNEGFDMNDVYD